MSNQSPIPPKLAQILKSRRWSGPDAAIVIAAWRRSGLSRRAFCDRHDLDVQRLARWAKQLPSAPAMAEVVLLNPPARRQSVLVVERGAARVVDRDVDDDHLARDRRRLFLPVDGAANPRARETLPRWPRGRILELAPAYWRETLEKQEAQRPLGADVCRWAMLEYERQSVEE